jgi:hypothetical protein
MASKAKHFRARAMFLVFAREDCLANWLDTVAWLGFRCKVWHAVKVLRSIKFPETKLIQQLETMLNGLGANFTHPLSQWIEAMRGGLQSRLSGGRATKPSESAGQPKSSSGL